MVRRITEDDDLDRLSDNLFISEGDLISDRDSFDISLKRYAPDNNLSKESKEELFRIYRMDHAGVSEERLFKKAKGKDLERDRRQTAKRVTRDFKEFRKKGARKVDFAGLDTTERDIRKFKRVSKEFTIPAMVRNKVVFSKRTFVVVKGKRQLRFRDSKGRFASRR